MNNRFRFLGKKIRRFDFDLNFPPGDRLPWMCRGVCRRLRQFQRRNVGGRQWLVSTPSERTIRTPPLMYWRRTPAAGEAVRVATSDSWRASEQTTWTTCRPTMYLAEFSSWSPGDNRNDVVSAMWKSSKTGLEMLIPESRSANAGTRSRLNLDREEPQCRFHERCPIAEISLSDCIEVAGMLRKRRATTAVTRYTDPVSCTYQSHSTQRWTYDQQVMGSNPINQYNLVPAKCDDALRLGR